MRATVACLIGTAVVVAIGGLVGASETLPSSIRTVWTAVEPDGQFDVAGCILRPPTGAARGIQIVLLCLLFGGPPSAILAAALRRARRAWVDSWASVFLAGFVFQLSSMVLTAFLLAALLSLAPATARERRDLPLIGGSLVLGIAYSIWGIRSWRELQLRVRDEGTVLGRL